MADTGAVAAKPDDWRRRGQERYLLGAKLTWRQYQALSPEWEHEHCEFCWQKFLDPNYSPAHAEALRERPKKYVAAGYTDVQDTSRPAGQWWICEQCFADFHDEFRWTLVNSDADDWPYQGAEPQQRPTATDYDEAVWVEGAQGRWLRRPE